MKYLGVDFGLKRIGLALSEGELSSPWKILEVNNLPDAILKVTAVIKLEEVDVVIVGIPDGRMSKQVLKFAKLLEKSGVKVIINDETLSTKKAITRMVELNIPKKKRKFNDAYSAAEILQDYLDNLPSS